MSQKDALKLAKDQGLDLVEIAKTADPPVVKITDYGKYQYEQNKLKRDWAKKDKEKGKGKSEDAKSTQIKPGTSGGILEMRAKKIREWLDNGNTVNVTLFLFGRYKGQDDEFLKGKFNSFLETIPGEYKMVDEIKKSPKGFSVSLKTK